MIKICTFGGSEGCVCLLSLFADWADRNFLALPPQWQAHRHAQWRVHSFVAVCTLLLPLPNLPLICLNVICCSSVCQTHTPGWPFAAQFTMMVIMMMMLVKMQADRQANKLTVCVAKKESHTNSRHRKSFILRRTCWCFDWKVSAQVGWNILFALSTQTLARFKLLPFHYHFLPFDVFHLCQWQFIIVIINLYLPHCLSLSEKRVRLSVCVGLLDTD